MTNYILANKLIKSINNYQEGAKAALNPIDGDADYYKGKIDACEDIKEFITPLQQEQPEVDLEEKFNDFLDNVEGVPRMWHSDEQIEWGKDIARHFFELGLNARKV